MFVRASSVLVLLVATTATLSATNSQPDQDELKRLSIEELMNVDVTLTSRRPEPVGTTAAAVSVVANEDIRRTGVVTIPDAVGLATGVHAARYNNSSWSISARGFNAVTANKMLVMVDGRTVYSPLFSGVFWNTVDYTLGDLDRIEVVRGPGAALWGANAVNGVVNIVTRPAQQTLGTYAEVASGNEDPLIADVRHGAALGAGAYRVYAKYAARSSQRFADHTDAGDGRRRGQVGFRFDRGDSGATMMLKGDVFYAGNDFPDRRDGSFFFADVQGRWTRPLSSRTDVQIQTYLNHERRKIPQQLTHHLTTVDVDAQQTMGLRRHQLVWGAGVRVNHDTTEGTPIVSFDPPNRTYPVVNTFVQDDIALALARLFVTPGIKVERNAFSGVEVQPGVRARLLLPRNQTLWGSVARAVRRPTRFDEDIRAGTATGLLLARGNREFHPERLVAGEIGYRVRPTAFVSADLTVFHHALDRLRSQESPVATPIPIVVGNTLNGTSTGVEAAVTLQPVEWWGVSMSYTGMDVSITRDADSRDVGRGLSEANDPPHQFSMRNSVDLPGGIEADVRVRRVSALPAPRVPAYAELGFRVAWAASRTLTLALTGEDLLDAHHPEFNPSARGFEEFQRSLRATLTIRTR